MTNRAHESHTGKVKRILLIGDWIVDDNWVLGEQHKSDTSTYVGRHHYKALHHAGGAVKRHCGAGRVAAIMRLARWPDGTPTEILGVGLWNHEDSDRYLHRMFTPEYLLGANGHRVVATPDQTPKPPHLHFFNIGTVLAKLKLPPPQIDQFNSPDVVTNAQNPFIAHGSLSADNKCFFGTTRAYRLYIRSLTGLQLASRVDWELPPLFTDGGGQPAWFPPPDSLLEDNISSTAKNALHDLLGELPEIDAVIIKDHGKGVVCKGLLEYLLEVYPKLKETKWFIQTKRWQPAYLSILESQVRVAALVYHNIALSQCKKVSTWFTGQRRVSPEAIEELMRMNGGFKCDVDRRICSVLTGPFSAIALESEKENQDSTLIYQPYSNPNEVPLEGAIGGATAFFSSLCFGLLQDKDHKISGSELLDGALRVAQHSAQIEYDRLLHPEALTPPEELVISVAPGAQLGDQSQHAIYVYRPQSKDDTTSVQKELKEVRNVITLPTISSESDRWQHALGPDSMGLLRLDKEEWAIELSRSTIELQDYVCCAPSKRRQLSELRKALGAFDGNARQRALAGMLTAKPGTGKTTLVRSLAKTLKLQQLSYNVTNMSHIDDLLSCFDQIVTAQLENREQKILVFVDEINAKIGSHHVYESFLTPLEDGYYVRSGSKRFILPCLWLFVGTDSLENAASDSKASDFLSRMSLRPASDANEKGPRKVFNLSEVPIDEKPYLMLENIYAGAFIARSEFPGLMKLHRDVIAVLASFKIDNGVTASSVVSLREIRQLVTAELYVDGHGRGMWRDFDDVKSKYGGIIETTMLAHKLLQLHQPSYDDFISVYHTLAEYSK